MNWLYLLLQILLFDDTVTVACNRVRLSVNAAPHHISSAPLHTDRLGQPGWASVVGRSGSGCGTCGSGVVPCSGIRCAGMNQEEGGTKPEARKRPREGRGSSHQEMLVVLHAITRSGCSFILVVVGFTTNSLIPLLSLLQHSRSAPCLPPHPSRGSGPLRSLLFLLAESCNQTVISTRLYRGPQ